MILLFSLKMLLCYFFIVLNVASSYSFQYNLTVNFGKFSNPELYAQHVQTFLAKNENQNIRCKNHVKHYLDSLIQSNKTELWALQMFDSGTKIPSGFLSGNMGDFGAFDECLEVSTKVNEDHLRGKYCLGSIPINLTKIKNIIDFKSHMHPKTVNLDGELGFMFATCLPDSCTTKDIQDIYSESGYIKVKFFDQFCQSKSDKPKFGAGDIAFTTFMAIVFYIIIMSTIYDVYLFYNNKKSAHILLTAFSVLTNGRKLLAITKNPNQITSIHGIRVISMMWIILGHRYRAINMHPKRNGLEILQWLDTAGNMYIIGATVSVDTFLLLSGLVVAYIFMSAMAKGVKFNIIMFYVHRYIRLTPVFVVLLLLYITIFIHLGSGPFWKYDIDRLAAGCRNNWWASLIYVQNYVSSKGICIEQTWYLSVDTQLYLLSPLILIPLKKWPKVGIILTSCLGLASMVASFVIGYIYEFRGQALANRNPKFAKLLYMPTHTRATPWLMGILVGYYIFKIKQSNRRININKVFVLILWIFSLGLLATCLFTGHNTLKGPYDRIAESFYLTLLRPSWALGVSIVILLCELGYGGPINWFLSIPVFEVLSRLTYTMYLIHMAMQAIVMSQNRVVEFGGDLMGMHGYWGDYVFTAGASVIFTLAFESPIIALEKIIFGNTNTKNTTESKTLESAPERDSKRL